MRRRSLFTLGCTVVVGLAAATPVTMRLRGSSDPANAGDGPRAQVIGIAEALQLHWLGDGPQDRSQCKVILSELPILPERHVRLNIHQPDFTAWRGTVAVYVGQPAMLHVNGDPEHPDRVAVWCGSFVYGDPALIERLRSCEP